MSTPITILIHPSCSKCQSTLPFKDKFPHIGIQYIDYTSAAIPDAIIDSLVATIPFDQLIRTSEPVFQERYASMEYSTALAIQILKETPTLMQRPILIHGTQVILGRPPALIEAYLESL